MKNFNGRVLFLDRSDINTDEIIPAKYLTEVSKVALKPYCLEDLKLPGFDASKDLTGKTVVLSRDNFGCGSSREHAPWALEVNGLNAVVASGFARIFRGNMFNGGLLAVTLKPEEIAEVFTVFAGKDTELQVDWKAQIAQFTGGGVQKTYPLNLGEFEKALVEAGGWVEFASKRY